MGTCAGSSHALCEGRQAGNSGSAACRTLHTATDAKDTKWIAQQWVACGYQAPSTPGQTFQVVPGLPSVVDDIEKKAGKKARGKKGVRQLAGKGFGAK